MAIQHAILSISVEDADGNQKSFADYISYNDATATLSSLAAAVSAEVATFDAVTDAKVLSATLALEYVLPEGLKTDPEVGSNVQESGLLNFDTDSPDGLTYSQAIPAMKQAGFTGKTVNGGQTDVAAWVTLVTTVGTFSSLDDRRAFRLISLRRGRKSFRK